MKEWFYVAVRLSYDISYLIDIRIRLQMMNFEIDNESITVVNDLHYGLLVIMKVYGDADILKAMSYKIKEIHCDKINGPVLLVRGLGNEMLDFGVGFGEEGDISWKC